MEKEWFVHVPAITYRRANGEIVTIPSGNQRWAEIDGKCATDCIFEGKGYTAEQFLANPRV